MFDAKGNLVDNFYFWKLNSNDLSIIHNGDNLTGKGSGDDETIQINLDKVHSKVDSIWPVINVYTWNRQIDDLSGAYCRLNSNNQEFCRYDLSLNKDGVSNGCIMASLKR